MRRLLAGAVLCVAPASGFSQAARRADAGPVDVTRPPEPRVTVWDSLYVQHRYFEAREALAQWHGAQTPAVQYMHGVLASAFNAPDLAIALLKPLVDHPPPSLTPAQLRRAVDALGRSYRAVSLYRASAEVYDTALHRQRRLVPDSAMRTVWRAAMQLGQLLRDVLPQRVAWASAVRRDTVPNGGVRFAIRPGIDGAQYTSVLRVDLRTPVTILDSTAAARTVRFLDGTVETVTPAGVPVTARVGVIASLRVGVATVSNVVTLVVSDGNLAAWIDNGDSVVAGVIGFPILNALGQITFTRDGHIALSSPGMLQRPAPTPLSGTSVLSGARAPDTIGVAFFDTLSGVSLLAERHVGERRTLFALEDEPFPTLDSLAAGDSTLLSAPQQIDAATLDLAAMTLTLEPPQPPSVFPTITYPTQGQPARSAGGAAKLPEDLVFVALLFALFVIPKALQRYRIPGAITSLVMGAVVGGAGFLRGDPTVHLLATFGIVALFLFAGLEIDGHMLRRNFPALALYSTLWVGLVSVTTWIAIAGFGVAVRPAILVALALMTPSTGFILSSLAGFGLHQDEQVVVKTYTIGSELLALAVLFFVLQSTSVTQLALALAAMLGVVIVIPLAFRFFAAVVAPHAPRSEFAFLLMVAVVCAYATRRLGVYYLVGAFLVGVAAQLFRGSHPAMSSEQMVDALESFGSVFVPFYFFHAGTTIVGNQLTPMAIGIGVLLVAVCIPVRIGVIALQRRQAFGEPVRTAYRIGSTLAPTLVFTLVLAELLHDRFAMADTVVGALAVYTVLNTTVPAFLLRGKAPEFEHVGAEPDVT